MGYVPLDKRAYFVPEVLDGMEQLALVCIDNIECIAGDEEWEMAIFNLYNRILETGRTRLFITGDRPPRQLNLRLPDLASRLDWGQIYKLQPLSDEEKLLALQLRGKLRGFELPEDVGRFLLKRLDREMRTLFMTLDQLDRASITAQRKLTIPFVKEILGLVIGGAAVLAILLSCIGKLAAAIQAVPVPVMGGVSLLLYGVIGASGIRVLIESKVDYNKAQNLILTSVILIIGVSGAKVHIGAAELKGMALATIVGIGLSLLFKVISLFRKEEEVLDAPDESAEQK